MPHKLLNLVRAPGRLVRFLAEAPDLLQSVRKALKAATEASRESTKTNRKSMKLVAASERRVAALQKDVQTARDESRMLKEELHERLLQYNLQLGRLARRHSGSTDTEESKLAARSVPLAIDEPQTREWESVEGPPPDPAGREWLMLDACPACGHTHRTIVNPFNKLVLLKSAPDTTAFRYDYSLCHACGMVYAARRPVGSRYRHLLEHFGEVIGKGDGKVIKNPLLNPLPLTEEDRQKLTRMTARGVWVSDHLRVPKGEYLDALMRDRFENSVHLDLLSSLVAPKGGRVLEIRPRTGTISDGLRRLFGVEVCALPIWESQRFLLKQVYGIDSPCLVDYDEFTIPFEGRFDLIICNHMLTHVIRLSSFLDTIVSRLNPGGHVYFYNDPEDTEFLQGSQSMLANLNPLHMQTFDQPSLVRALAARGLNVTFLRTRNLDHMCLAQPGQTSWSPMTTQELEARRHAYRLAYDRSVLLVPPDLRTRFAEEWPQVVARGVAEGLAEFDGDGNLRLVARAAIR